MYFWPFLKAGATFAVRQSAGTLPLARDLQYINRRIGAIASASSYNTQGPMLSGPVDLLGSRSFSSFLIPFSVMLISSITGKSSSDDDIRQEWLNSSLLTSSLLVKTDWNCLFRSSALSSGCE